MANKRIFENDTMHLTECRDGFWFYDKTLGCNTAMRAATEREALIEALKHSQHALVETKAALATLQCRVNSFVESFNEGDNDDN